MYYLALLCNYTAKHLTVGVGIVFRWHMTKKYVSTGYLIKVTDGINESRCFFLELINKRHCLLFDSVEYLVAKQESSFKLDARLLQAWRFF